MEESPHRCVLKTQPKTHLDSRRKFKEQVSGTAIWTQIACPSHARFLYKQLQTSCFKCLSFSEVKAYLTIRVHTVVSHLHLCRVRYLASTQDAGTIYIYILIKVLEIGKVSGSGPYLVKAFFANVDSAVF